MFKFRLASIMRLREHMEKQCREEVGKCLQSLQVAELTEARLVKKEQEIIEDLICRQKGIIKVTPLLLGKDYLKFTNAQLQEQREVVKAKNEELNKARNNLIEAMKEKKVLEKLREKQYQDYLYDENKIEQALFDDMTDKEGLT